MCKFHKKNMFEKLKDKIFAYRLRKTEVQAAAFPDYQNIRSVLILFESDPVEKNADILKIRDELLQQDKDIVLLGYAEKKEITSLVLPQRRILGLNDITFWGGLKDDVVNDLQKRRYELLIDLTQRDVRPLQYAALLARADFKVGIRRDNKLYQFMVDTPAQQSPRFLFDQIQFYLRNIKSNDKA